ncbi:MAG: hypothetical protein ABW138_11930, partial [Candidatus Thiodiazotropha sp. 4PDIVS1]
LAGTLFRQAKNKKQSYQFALIEFLSNDMSSKQWVFHPRYERCHQQALAQLDVKAKTHKANKKRHRRRSEPLHYDSVPDNIQITAPTEEPIKRRVLFECVMCKSQWEGLVPGGGVCSKCNTHLYTTRKEELE